MGKDTFLISPNFKIPEGAEDDFEYTESFEDEGIIEVGESTEKEQSDVVLTFTIISQKLRRVKGKTQVVDVVFETEELGGVSEYEIEVAKA